MPKKLQVFLLTVSIVIVAFVLVGDLAVSASSSNNNTDGAYSHIEVYSEVLYYIRTEYVEEPNMPMVTSGALHGLLESLDANSSYLSPAEYKTYKDKKAGGKAGIGATISKRFGYAAVVSVLPGGPADKAGIGSGDIIETIDGKSTHDMSLAEIKSTMTGQIGSNLECSIIRIRKIEPQKVTITRNVVPDPAPTDQLMPESVGYIKALVLTKGKAQEIENDIKALQKDGAKKLVLDLRDDSEGDEEEGAAVANLFLDHGLVGYLEGQKFTRQSFNADPRKKVTDLPVAVLVNHGTAGAAEFLAAAILENARGDVVGDKTFGDGSVQKVIEVPDGSALILSVAKYYTPKGKVIQENGITPNIEVASADEVAILPDDDDGASAPTEEPARATPKDDEQLHRALEVLKSKGPKT